MKYPKLSGYVAIALFSCIASVSSLNAATQPESTTKFFTTVAEKFLTGPDDRLLEQKVNAYAVMFRLNDELKNELRKAIVLIRAAHQKLMEEAAGRTVSSETSTQVRLQPTIDASMSAFWSKLPKDQVAIIDAIAIESTKRRSFESLRQDFEAVSKQ